MAGNPWARRAAAVAAVAAPGAVGIGVAIAWAAGDTVPPVDPVSVAGLGLVGSAGAASVLAWRPGRPLPLLKTPTLARERGVWAAWGVAAILGAWVVANRLAGLSTGPVRPGLLLVLAAAVVGLALAAGRWGSAWRRGVLAAATAYGRAPDRWNLRLVAIVAASARLAILFRVPVFVIGDSGGYVEAAGTIARDGSFAPLLGIYPPAYSIFLAGTWAVLGPDFLAVAAVQHALGVVTAVATYGVARAALPPAWALVPALATATNGYLLILEHGIYTEALFVPLLVTAAWLATRLLGTRPPAGWRLAAATGGLVAVASLVRLVLQPFLLVLAAGMLLAGGWPPRREAFVRVGALLGAFAVAASPWVAHNWIVHGYVGLSNGLGVSALLPRLWEEEGTYAWANPAHPDPEVRRVTVALQEERDRGASYWQAYLRIQRDFPGRNASDLVAAGASDVIWRHPALFIDRTWFRLRRLRAGGFARETVNDLYGEQANLGIRSPVFAVTPDGGAVVERAGNQAHALTRLVRPDDVPPGVALVLVALAGAGAMASRRPLAALVPVGLGTGLIFLAVLLNSDRARYRHPAEPFLVVAYAMGAHAAWRGTRWAWHHRRGRRPVDAGPVPA